MMQFEPLKEHLWLNKLVGEWTFESECAMGPDQPPMTFKGTESVRSLGGAWVICEGGGDVPGGGKCSNIMTLGYDPQKKRFVGTFISSAMTHLWVYDGALEPGDKILSLHAEGPRMDAPDKVGKYIDSIESLSDDHRTLTAQMLGDDGKWVKFMTAHYRRKK